MDESEYGVVEGLFLVLGAAHLVALPGIAEGGRVGEKVVQPLGNGAVAALLGGRGPEHGDHALDGLRLVAHHALPARIEQAHVQAVALQGGQTLQRDAHQALIGSVGCEQVKGGALHLGRVGQQLVEQLHVQAARLVGIVRRRLIELDACQRQQMAHLVVVALQRSGNGLDRLARRLDLAALFQLGVPGHADTGELGNFLAPQAGRAHAAMAGQPHSRGRQALAAGAQKAAQLLRLGRGRNSRRGMGQGRCRQGHEAVP
ncbi:hypothetical protein D3C72_1563930 [compost metagenome]